MAGTTDETIKGFNEFLKSQKEVEGEANFTLYQFATHSDKLYSKNIKEVEDLTSTTYRADGASTAYCDALGKAINEVGERLKNAPENERPEKVVFVVITDGIENASMEFNKPAVKKMVQHQESVYKWQFVFLGANLDAVAEGKSMGIIMANSLTYAQNEAGIGASYMSVARNLSDYRTEKAASMAFTEQDREEQEEALKDNVVSSSSK
jgi:hypothetical protein